jgi:S-adenosylmethionine decarboxylase proenzyme
VDTLGRHLILEAWGCGKEIINSVDIVKSILIKATEAAKATLVDLVCHRFSPYGVTGVAILAESHISVHTWPEYGYAAVDIFICGNTINSQNAAAFITRAFHAQETSLIELERGDLLSKTIRNDKPTKETVCIVDSNTRSYL